MTTAIYVLCCVMSTLVCSISIALWSISDELTDIRRTLEKKS
jgi:hypothetical protein